MDDRPRMATWPNTIANTERRWFHRAINHDWSIDTMTSLITPETFGIHRVISVEKMCKYKGYYVWQHLSCDSYTTAANAYPEKRETAFLTVSELHDTELLWLGSCQSTTYQEETDNIKSHKSFPSILKQLGLFLDSSGLIRCNGRIHNASLDSQTSFPNLLPPTYNLTRLIVLHAQ